MQSTKLAQKFNLPRLLLFVFPTIVMMVFMSLYTSVDGAFVSRLIGEDALAAVNVVYPVMSVVLALSLMFTSGANAIIARMLGEGQPEKARRFFSLIYIVGTLMGIAATAIILLLMDPLLSLLGATETLYSYAREYLTVLCLFAPMLFLQVGTQNFFVTEGKPGVGLLVSALGGIANIILDYVFIAVFHMGIAGAALATGIGYMIPGLYGVGYFFASRKGTLWFAKPEFEGGKLLHTCTNGSSELVNNLSVAITTMLFNLTMLRYAGEGGVAAITVILYVQFIQAAIYFGYSQGIAPVISYKYGAGDKQQLRYVVKTSLWFMLVCSVLVIILSVFGADLAVSLFIRPGSPVYALTKCGFLIFSSAYLFMGINIFLSAMFTAFGNGAVSALLSFLRTLVFLVGTLLLLPLWLGVDGAWIAVPVAEALALVVGVICYRKYRAIYHYGQEKTKG